MIMSHPEFFLVRKNSFLADLSELAAKKRWSLCGKNFGMAHTSAQKI
jgi:hypothetical protein